MAATLPCLEMLDAIPGILRGLMCELSEDDTNWKPAPYRFSIAEVLAHLSHTEAHCNRLRVDRFMSENRPVFEDFDAQDHPDSYRSANAEDAFDHFEEQRETNVEYLRGLPPGSGDRVAVHRVVGEMTLAQMLNSWVLHDLGHARQIAELVRARKYLADAGPMAQYHELKP